MTSFQLRQGNAARTRADVVVVGLIEGPDGPEVAPGGEDVAQAWGRKWPALLAALGARGKAGEAHKIPTSGSLSAPLLVAVGLGKVVDGVSLRRAAGVSARAVGSAGSVALSLPATSAEEVRAVTEGFALGGYRFTAYRSDAGDEAPGSVTVLSPVARRTETKEALEVAQVLAAAVSTTRDWINIPAGDFVPAVFAEAVADAVAEAGKGRGAPRIKVTVHDEKKLAELGCGGILGVGGGSAAPPRLVELTWSPRKASAHVALVGKGITYDSGGLSIKTAQGMTEMKCDMSGAAAVVQATIAIARLGLPVKVSAFVPMAENMVSGTSMRPGDVLTMYGGKTVECLNTDAEGRLILADALGRATEARPDVVLDVATLTGAMQVALGDRVGGVLGSDEIVAAVVDAGARAGEYHWAMPIPEQMNERIRSSKIADLSQTDMVRWGGGLLAAAFLREFTGGLPWAHLDIAGPAFHSGREAYGHITPGGTGFAVTTLVEYARSLVASN